MPAEPSAMTFVEMMENSVALCVSALARILLYHKFRRILRQVLLINLCYAEEGASCYRNDRW